MRGIIVFLQPFMLSFGIKAYESLELRNDSNLGFKSINLRKENVMCSSNSNVTFKNTVKFEIIIFYF
jgi:hypothetical protein